MKLFGLTYEAIRDLIIRYLPNFHKKDYSFAFLVHPRQRDIYEQIVAPSIELEKVKNIYSKENNAKS